MPPIVVLAAGLALAGAPPVLLGGAPLPLDVALEVRTAARGATPAPLAWVPRSDGALVGRARGVEWEATLVLAPAPGGARALDVAVRWTAPAEVERVAVRLAWPGRPSAVRRDLGFGPLDAPLRVERGTPLLVAAGGVVLAGGGPLAAARVEADGARTAVTLLLDDAAARPFSTYEACLDRLPGGGDSGPPVPWGALEAHRHPLLLAPRARGETDRARATLYAVAEGQPFLPVVVERWPAGARAAIVVTDHADRTDPDALRAILWGASDPRAEGGVGAGFLGRGVALTRTFFAHARRGGLDDPEVRSLADDLVASGSEVGLHSVSGEPDRPEAVREGVASAAPWRPVTWIDHEPYTNCEALSAQGARRGPWRIDDLLARAGIRWAWAAGDLGSGATRIVDLLGGASDEARAAVYPFPLDPRLWIFRSSMFYAAPAELADALSDPALDRLERAHGLFVAHTYLGASTRTTHAPDHLRRLAVRDAPGGGLVIDPALDAALARIAARVAAGRLASLPWAVAGDRLRALGEVEVAYLPDGAAELRNRGDAPLPGLTLALPAEGLDLAVEGALLLGREDEDGWARIWLDLPAGGRVRVRASDRLVPVPLLPLR